MAVLILKRVRGVRVVNKDKIIKAEIYNSNDQLIISTETFEFPKDFFSFSSKEFIVLKGTIKVDANKGDKVYAVFYYRNGNRIRYDTEVDLCTDLQVNIHIGRDYQLLEERRRSFKTQTDVGAFVLSVIRNDETEVLNPPKAIRIHNINLGGIFIVSDYEFKVGDKFLISMLDDKIQTLVSVLRKQKVDNSDLPGYGCRFETITPQQESLLSRFIFDCQLAERERLKKLGY